MFMFTSYSRNIYIQYNYSCINYYKVQIKYSFTVHRKAYVHVCQGPSSACMLFGSTIKLIRACL